MNIIVSDFSSKLDLIDKCPLPLIMKLEGIKQLPLSEVQHLFSIVHIQQKSLSEMNKKIEGLVRKWFGLNTHSTRDIIFHPQWEGGLGVPNVMWIYTGMRISHFMNMLNSDDKDVSEFARSSLFLDLSKHKVLLAKESEPHFLGFKRKSSGKLDSHSAGFAVWSDWPDLNDLCFHENLYALTLILLPKMVFLLLIMSQYITVCHHSCKRLKITFCIPQKKTMRNRFIHGNL